MIRLRQACVALAILLAVSRLDGACHAGSAEIALPVGVDQRKLELVWFDDFDSFDLSLDGRGEHKWFNGLWYMKPAPIDLFSHSDGVLKLSTRGKVGALISTLSPKKDGHGVVFSHGYFEARMAMTVNRASWPAFWLFSKDHAHGTDGNHWCEIDIFELFSSNKYGGTVHEWINFKNSQNRNNLADLPADADLTRWHTYGMMWEPGKVTWYFDKKPLMSAATPAVCDAQELFLILNTNTRDPSIEQFLMVDWVAVYKRKP